MVLAERFSPPDLPEALHPRDECLPEQPTMISRMEQAVTYLVAAYGIDISQKVEAPSLWLTENPNEIIFLPAQEQRGL